MRHLRYTVIGAGHGGKAMAAHLAVMGFEVTLYNRTLRKLRLSKLEVESLWIASNPKVRAGLVN